MNLISHVLVKQSGPIVVSHDMQVEFSKAPIERQLLCCLEELTGHPLTTISGLHCQV